MPQQQSQPIGAGLYLLRQKSARKPVDHYGILDVGNRLCRRVIGVAPAVVLHQTPPTVSLTLFEETGEWEVLSKIDDEPLAIARAQQALRDPGYDLFGHNCEHFARYVATGKRESTQLQFVGVVLGVAAILYATRKGVA